MASRAVSMMAPQTARQARLLRLANRMSRENAPGAPKTETDKLLYIHSQSKAEADQRLSVLEETLRAKMMPNAMANNAISVHSNATGDNLFQFRDYPMFPGEYIPPRHETLRSVRDTLRADLTAQSMKDAWLKVSGGKFFESPTAFYSKVDGLDESQLGDIVNAMFPDLDGTESRAMVQRVMETISSPANSTARNLGASISADALGLDSSPGHYTNFLEWMGRITGSKGFATEHSISQFCRRAFNQKDVIEMYQNYQLLSKDALRRLSADSYSHFYAVLKDYSIKVQGSDTRHQVGVRIDEPEIDRVSGMSFGYGRNVALEVLCMLKPNTDGTGQMYAHGKTLGTFLEDRSWYMEKLLAVFDEAGLKFQDFDVYFSLPPSDGTYPSVAGGNFAEAGQFALATALVKMIPLTRIPLKKAGLLSFDRRTSIGDHPGFLNGRAKRRPFSKRANFA